MTDQLRYFPLMAGQMDFWQEWREHPDEPISTVAHAIRLEGEVDHDALGRAITAVIAETDVMALRFRVRPDGQPEQAIDPDWRPKLRLIDLSAEAEAEATAISMMQADIAAPLDLLGPMSVQWLFRMPQGAALWYLRGHHIFLDGYAMALIENRCAALYAEEAGGPPAGLGFARLSDLIAEDLATRSSDRHIASRDWWSARLGDLTLPSLQRGQEDYAADPLSAEIDLSDLSGPLLETAKAAKLGWPDLLTLLSGIWLGNNLSDQIIWLPWMGRLGSVAAKVPAMVVNILPLAITAPPDVTLGQALANASSDLRQLRRHGAYRIEDISRDVGLAADRRFFFSPLVNVMPFDPPIFPGCNVQREVLAAGPGDGTNLTFAANSRGEGLMVEISVDPTLTEAAEFARLRDGLPQFLRRATQPGALDQPLRELLG